MESHDEPVADFRPSEGDANDYWPAPELRQKGLPAPISALCGAILLAGLGWTLFGGFGAPTAAALAADSTLAGSELPPEIDGMSNISVDDTLDAAAAAVEGSTSALGTVEASVAEPAVAVLTCRVQSMAVDAWRCIYPANEYDSGGYLKVNSGGQITRYGPNEVMSILSGSTARLELAGNYSVEAQTNGDSDYTLRLEIQRGGGVIYQDEGSEYDTLRVSE
jgi:hypothetical protein